MTQIEFNRAVQKIQAELKTEAEAEVRRRWREDHGVIYVRTYTVQAYVRPVKPRRRRRAS